MNTQKIIDTARAMVFGDKGLLAMDESNSTCNKRFARLGIPQTEEARRAWRELIVTTPGLGECINTAHYGQAFRNHKKAEIARIVEKETDMKTKAGLWIDHRQATETCRQHAS